MYISTVQTMRELDGRAASEFGIDEFLLMENAGAAALAAVKRESGIAGKNFAVVCGIGNNGGDGLALARMLHADGGIVTVFCLGDPSKFGSSSRKNFEIVSKIGVRIETTKPADGLQPSFAGILAGSDMIIDGLFGTGISRNIEGLFREAVDAINASGRPVLSLDIPSGINGDTAAPMPVAVRATATVTFGLPKLGNVLYPGHAYCGRLYHSHISFPPSLYANGAGEVRVNIPQALPPRDPAGHKGTFGDVLVIAGAPGYFGAPAFAGNAVLRGGGGYCRLAAPRSVVPHIAPLAPGLVFIPLEETAAGSMSEKNIDVLLAAANTCDMVVIGPGLSTDDETMDAVRSLVVSIEKPLLIDGDALTAVSSGPIGGGSSAYFGKTVPGARKYPTVLTPHVGEMARLTGLSIPEVIESRLTVLTETAIALSCVIVLKGAHSLIGFPDGSVFVNMSGNSGMATAGSGDVLSGTIGAMYGIGLGLEQAVKAGVFIHGLAGDIAAADKGEDGMTAADILDALPEAVRRYRCDRDALILNSCGKIIRL